MKNFKRLICGLLMVCMLIPLGSMMISANSSTPDISWRNNTSDIIYFDGYDATTETPNNDDENIGTTASGTQLIGNGDHTAGVTYEKYDGKDYYLRVNKDTHYGIWQVHFVVPSAFDVRSNPYGNINYLSFRYKVVNAGSADNTSGEFQLVSTNNGHEKSVKFTGALKNDTWQTVTVSLADGNNWAGGARVGNVIQGGRCQIQLPALGDGGYYVIDYFGMFETQAVADSIQATHDEFAADGTLTPYAPELSLEGGTYTSVQTVSIEKFNRDAVIYYTTNGDEPTNASTEYTEPITVDTTQTIKAIAYIGEKKSEVTSATYTIDLSLCATPKFSLTGSVVPSDTPVEITTATEGADIYYTTDGSVPTKDNGTKYTTPIEVTIGMTLKAIAVKDAFTDSAVASQTYSEFLPKDIFWEFSSMKGGSRDGKNTLSQGVYNNDTFPKMVVACLDNDGKGVNITNAYNTENGGFVVPFSEKTDYGIIRVYPEIMLGLNTTIPNANWNYVTVTYKSDNAVDFAIRPHTFQYDTWSTSTELPASETYRSVVINMHDVLDSWGEGQGHFGMYLEPKGEGATNFEILSLSFHVNEEAANKEMVSIPVASVEAGSYTTEISVELTSATSGASIYYTTDGSVPSITNGTLYEGAIKVSADTTIKAIAVKENCYDSVVATFKYDVTPTVSTPVVNLDAGKYEGTQKIEITCETDGAKIYYTLDGTNPTATNGTLYEGPIEISENCILKVIAIKDGLKDSKVVGRNYQIIAVEGSSNNNGSDGADASGADASDTEIAEEKKGCKSSITMASVAMITVLSGAGVVVCRKKKD